MFFPSTVKIKKRTLPEWSAFLLLFLPFIYGSLVELLGVPGVVRFLSDFLIMASVIIILFRSSSHGVLTLPKITRVLTVLVTVFFLYTAIGYVLNFKSAFYYVWGARNNFRFYLAFFIFITFLEVDDAKTCLKIFEGVFWINFAIVLFQYFGLGFEQDFLGGIFGTQKGCNGYMIAFISVVIAKTLLSYMNGSEKVSSCILKCGAILILAALAELKIVFLIFILFLTISAMLTKFSARKFFLILFAFILIVVAYTILISLFEVFDGFLSVDYLMEELFRENYASKEDMGRFTSVPTICKRFLTTFSERLLGMGLGNCDTSTISIFNTAFYDTYVDVHYSIFSVSFIFLETGFVGLALFALFFILCFARSVKAFKKAEGNLLFNQMGIMMSLLCLVLMFYNSSLRTEAGYIIYFALALPYIGLKNKYMHAPAYDI